MTREEIINLVNHSTAASLGFTNQEGVPEIRKVFCTWHRGLGTHLISTGTDSQHVQALQKDSRACLYFNDASSGLCLVGEAVIHCDHEYKALVWSEGDEKYYPDGVDDQSYCIIEFKARKGRYYRFDGIGDISAEELAEYDKDAEMKDYSGSAGE